jgi:carboxypeptidase C (cathepsin A)
MALRLLTWIFPMLLIGGLGFDPGVAFGQSPFDTDSLVYLEHQVDVNGQRIHYATRTGYLTLEAEDGAERARMFFIAYTRLSDREGKDGTRKAFAEGDPSARPITFSFNGGPGSSSVWLHLGVLGPRRVATAEDGNTLPPPYRLEDNAYSWLDLTDLVFIDPVSTGYSRSAGEVEEGSFHGVEPDIASVGDFIRRYCSAYQRWGSPKFLIGESYGTTRAAGLTLHLQQRYGMELNGVILVSAITQFQTARFDAGNDLPYPLFLPSYAATAKYHGKLKAPYDTMALEPFLDEVEAFALGAYWSALAQGDALDPVAKANTVHQLAAYTGLSKTWLERADARINIHRFTKELLRDESLLVGRFDARMTGLDMDANNAYGERDPSYVPAIKGAFSTLINDYLGRELGFSSTLPYEVLTGRVRPWDWNTRNRYLNTADRLREAMEGNPFLDVWIANGYYDLATPYFATEYTLSHMGLSPEARARVRMSYHPAGHMMYLLPESLERMKELARRFYSEALQP